MINFNPEEILELARNLGCEWSLECECGHLKLDHDEDIGCLADGPSKSPDDPPSVENGIDYELCRCIKFRLKML